MYFPSKRDRWLAIVLSLAVAIMVSSILLTLQTPGALIANIVTIPAILFIGWIWFSTGYTITETDLLARSGPFQWRIPLGTIQVVRRTRNPLSSPALSLDRLEIEYAKGKRILISPQDDLAFVQQIQLRCPHTMINV